MADECFKDFVLDVALMGWEGSPGGGGMNLETAVERRRSPDGQGDVSIWPFTRWVNDTQASESLSICVYPR